MLHLCFFRILSNAIIAPSFIAVSGGSCWTSVKKTGRCGQFLRRGVTLEQCCKSNERILHKNQLVYSERDAKDSREIFFLVFVNRPRVCKPCPSKCVLFLHIQGRGQGREEGVNTPPVQHPHGSATVFAQCLIVCFLF